MNITAKPGMNQNDCRKRNRQMLRCIGRGHHQKSRDERKNNHRALQQEPHKRNKHLGCPLIRYSRPFLKWKREEHKQMNQRTRKLMMMHQSLYQENLHRQTICINKRSKNMTRQHLCMHIRINNRTRGLH